MQALGLLGLLMQPLVTLRGLLGLLLQPLGLLVRRHNLCHNWVIYCRTLYTPLLSMRGCFFQAKVWFGMLGTTGGTLLKPKLQQRVYGKSDDNISNGLGLLRGLLVLVGFSSHGEAHKGREVRPGPDRPPPCPLFVLADAWGCQHQLCAAGYHAGRQGGAAGLRKVAGASSSRVLACGDTSEEAIEHLKIFFTDYQLGILSLHLSASIWLAFFVVRVSCKF
eukprot:1154868-Pelagomonas_calceolata.AAC.5